MHFLNRFSLLTASTLLLASCVHVSVRTDTMMTPDDPPTLAQLPAGYVIDGEILQSTNNTPISVTYAHRPGNTTVLVFFGGDVFHVSLEGGEVLRTFAPLGVDIVMFDYPGYGGSPGEQTIQTIRDAALTVYDRLDALNWADSHHRVLYGFSLGGFIAPHVAQGRRVDGLILEATAPSVAAWVDSMIPWYAGAFVKADIDPALAALNTPTALAHFSGKVLVLASTNDKQAPPQLSRQLCTSLSAHNVRNSCHVFKDARHGKITKAPTYPIVVGDFLASMGSARE
jgi:uncharacterized protein